MFGDSITSPAIQWYGPTATWVNSRVSSPVTFINEGVPGDDVGALLARVNTSVIAHNPNFVVIEVGINNLAESLTSFGSKYSSILSAIRLALPNVRLALVSCFVRNEQYPDLTNGAVIAARDQQIRDLANTFQAAYIDVRGPQQAWEAANNTSNVVSGLLTIETPPAEGVHPNPSLGIPIYTTAAIAQIVTH